MNESTPLKLAVVGAGPVGLALALHAANALPDAEITLFDARPIDKDVSGDPRTLALSLGSVQLLERLGAWRPETAQPITEVHVSQQAPSLVAAFPARFGEPELTIRAIDEAVPMLGAVMSYGAIVAPLQEVWLAAEKREPKRLASRFGAGVDALKNVAGGVEVDAGIAERFDLAVVAEGGVFASTAKKVLLAGERSPALRHDYGQTAWVGIASFVAAAANSSCTPGIAYERFTRHGPAALLPLKDGRAGLVWCVDSSDDPVRELDAAQRVTVLNTIFHPSTPRLAEVSPLKSFPLGLIAERTLTDGRTVRIGNAAQTLHPVAGQGLNLGMRDAFELVRSLASGR
jgi:2-octaprenyl-6-methoxyphenol hydroxylase